MQHGQKLKRRPRSAFAPPVRSARGARRAYLLRLSRQLQYSAAHPGRQLRNRKLANIGRSGAGIVATGNIGCIQQLEGVSTARFCTRWNCWIGRPAARGRQHSHPK